MALPHVRSGCIWIDITELLDHFRHAPYPTGIARVVMSLADALSKDSGRIFNRTRFLLWDPTQRRPITIESSRILPLAYFLPRLMTFYSAAGLTRTAQSPRLTKAIITSFPRRLRYRIFPSDNGVTLFKVWAKREGLQLAPVEFRAKDILFMPGSFWLGRYAPALSAQAHSAGVPVTAFVHDMLLLSHPEWLPGRHSGQFRRGCEDFLPSCSAILCNSRHTRDELRRLIRLPDQIPVYCCRLGDETIGSGSNLVQSSAAVGEMLARPYVLYVSTFLPRKNHKLLVEAWRVLWNRLGKCTPWLLFVGGGHPLPALSNVLGHDSVAGGRIIRMQRVSDGDLHILYKHSLMTAYPSFGEGYGMPVAESLSHGKICLAAPSGGIPEIHDTLIDFIDVFDPARIADKVVMYLQEPSRRQEREAQIGRSYRSTNWSETASAVRFVLESTVSL